jgi:general secretion pathway protein G
MNKECRNRSSGFTLIELLGVIVVIVLLVSMVLVGMGYMHQKAGISRTKAEMGAIEMALEEFKTDYGAYPSSQSDMVRALQGIVPLNIGNPPVSVQVRKAYLPGFTGNDPFGFGYHYLGPGSTLHNGTKFYDLWSTGPNRVDETSLNIPNNDDITNW